MTHKPTISLLAEAQAELVRYDDLGAVERMREDADGWVFLVERFAEFHDACGCERCHPEIHGFAGDPSGL